MSADVRLIAEEFANNLDTGEHWNALVEGFMAGASWAKENLAVAQMTMEEAVELGKTDNEANWDNPVRLEAYRIRSAPPAPTSERVQALELALKPFAAMWDESVIDGTEGRPDDKIAWGFNNAEISWGDFRRASAALKATP